MPPERYSGPIPPEYDLADYDDEAVIKILAKIVRAKRHLTAAVSAIPDNYDVLLKGMMLAPHLEDTHHATGLSDALDILTPLRSGRRWNNVANEIAADPEISFPGV